MEWPLWVIHFGKHLLYFHIQTNKYYFGVPLSSNYWEFKQVSNVSFGNYILLCYCYLYIFILKKTTSLRKKCPYSELFWSAFSHIRTEYGEIRSISPYSVRMRENAGQNNSEYRHFLRSACHVKGRGNQIYKDYN